MALPAAPAPPPPAGWFLALLLCAVPLFTVRLGAKDLWEASEGRPLQSAREMRLAGDFLVQRTNGAVDLTKPPVYAWLTLAAFWATGADTEAAGRLPSVLAALGVLAGVFVLGRRVAGPRAGFLAGLALATTARFLWQARLAELETLLALGVVWACAAFDAWLEEDRPRRRAALAAAFHAAVGFAFAVKGPVALVLAWPGAAAFAVATGRARALLRPSLWAAFPAFLAVGLPWYLAVVARDPAHLDTFLAYAKGENVGHLRGPFWYLAQWPLYGLPWTPLAAWGLARGVGRGREGRAARTARLPVVAFAAAFLVQSALPAKQTHYLIPVVFPMGALLAGLVLDRWLAARADARAFGATAVPGAALVGATLLLCGALPALDADGAWPAAAGTLLAALGATVGVAARRGGLRGGAGRAGTAVAALLALLGFGAGWVVPRWNASQSARSFLAAVDRAVPRGAALAWSIFGSHSDYLWYLPMDRVGREGVPEVLGPDAASTVDRLRAWLAAGPGRHAMVTGAQADALGGGTEVLVRDDAFQKKGRRVALVRGGPR